MKTAKILSLFSLVSLAVPGIVLAQKQVPVVDRAKVADSYGKAEKRLTKGPDRWAAIAAGDLLAPDSAVRTTEHAGILLVMPDKHTIRVGENTNLELKEVGANNSYYFQLIGGEIWSFVNKARKPTKYEVETPSTVLGVSGTLFNISHNRNSGVSDMSVDDGVVSLRQGQVTQTVAKGFATRVRRNQLAQAKVVKQDPATKQMWKLLRAKESWTKPAANPKISQDTETEVRSLKQEHEKVVQQQQPTAAKSKGAEPAAAQKKAKPAAKAAPAKPSA